MRTFLLTALVTSSAAMAAPPATTTEVAACASPFCGGIQAAMEQALVDAGLVAVHGLVPTHDSGGRHWLTIVSTDARGLDGIAPRSGARTLPIQGTASFARTVPVTYTGIDTITVPGLAATFDYFLEIAGVDGGSGGGGSTSDGCYEVCWSTPTGVECWLECL